MNRTVERVAATGTVHLKGSSIHVENWFSRFLYILLWRVFHLLYLNKDTFPWICLLWRVLNLTEHLYTFFIYLYSCTRTGQV